MTGEQVLTCSLDAPSLARRVREWSEVVARATSRRSIEDRIVATYPQDPALLERLRNLIALESECCPFMEFSVEETPERIVVELRAPKEILEALAQV